MLEVATPVDDILPLTGLSDDDADRIDPEL